MSFPIRQFLLLLLLLLPACRAATEPEQGNDLLAIPRATQPPSPTPTTIVIPSNGRFHLNPHIAQRAAEGKPLVIRVSYHDISNEFAPFIRRGVVRAVEDFRANVELIGPVSPDAEVQIAELEQLLEIGVDGLAISPVNSELLTPIINRYLAQGIPVVTFNTDNPDSGRLAFIGQNLEESGYRAAKLLADALEGNGHVLIVTMDPQAEWSILREAGARRAFAEYPGISITQTVHAGTEPLEIYTSIEKALQAHPETTGILSLDCCSGPPAGEYIKRNGQMGLVKIVAFDELPRTLELIGEGVILASISQNPERQSYEAVQMLSTFISGKVTNMGNVDTGIIIITANNVSDFASK
jgi:simple sugar transport system substrate-binding protein